MYAAQLDQEGIVIQVIVGSAEWAEQRLGGRWVDSPKCGPGWTYIDGQFIPPAEENINDDDATLNN